MRVEGRGKVKGVGRPRVGLKERMKSTAIEDESGATA